MSRYPSPEKRFAKNWIPEPFSGCHLWTAACTAKGYGAIQVNGKQLRAHRLAWEISHGSIPYGLQVLHRCDTPSCVNPDHLFLGTNDENRRDAAIKDRLSKKLNIKDVLEIRRLYIEGFTQVEIAKMFKVCQDQISRIVNKKRRQHV